MQQLSIDMLKNAGAFAPAKPERREIKWITDDKKLHEAVIYVRKKSFLTLIEESKTASDSTLAMATRISGSIVDEAGQQIFKAEDIVGNDEHGPICDLLAMSLLNAIYDVNGVGAKADPKPLSQSVSSGKSSSLPELAAPRSKKLSKT
ncbi:phage tail assembly chaperone family protein, TAC [Vibrio anguillarum]|uniref:phage tail assembly chaperone family protein, TAC n=1 Tax=Vibrio anguillarum TaxID=55601 RepID=UPI003CF1481D